MKPIKGRGQLIGMELPLEYSAAAVAGRARKRYAALTLNPVTEVTTCPHCLKIFETAFETYPTQKEIENTRREILANHHCKTKGAKA